LNEDVDTVSDVSKKAAMLAGARRHLEAGHEKYILDTIHNHPSQVSSHLWYCEYLCADVHAPLTMGVP